MPVPNYVLLKRAQIILLVSACALMMCCKEKVVQSNPIKPSIDSVEEGRDTFEFDLDVAQLFCDMGIHAYTMNELRKYGIADIRPYDSIKTFWSIVDSTEYELYYLDGRAYKYKELEELCLNRLVYTKEEYKKIKKNPAYNVFECRFRTWGDEQERDTVINHVLVHYLK